MLLCGVSRQRAWWGVGCAVSFLAVLGISRVALADQQSQGMRDARKHLNEAQTELVRAKVALRAVVTRAEKQMEAGAEWKEAAALQREGQAKLAAATKRVKSELRSQETYRNALAEEKKRVEAREALRTDSKATTALRGAAAVAAMNAESAVKRLEREALEADTAYQEAKTALDIANVKLANLRVGVAQHLKEDKDYQAATDRLTAANTKVDEAAKELAEAKKQQEADDQRKLEQDVDNKHQAIRDLYRR